MVSGFTKFKERFQGFENQYVIMPPFFAAAREMKML